MFGSRRKPIVYAGPSLDWLTPSSRALMDLRPPIRRGDLDELRAGPSDPRVVLILDGLFGSNMAVTPTECRLLIAEGWTLVGASSMGALRAADLWPAGMIGIGEIYQHYRLGYLRSDADVAVAYDPDNSRELTASAVHVRSVLQHMTDAGAISKMEARKILQVSRTVPWHGRSWSDVSKTIVRVVGRAEAGREAKSLSAVARHHPKKRDACLALNTLFSERWTANRFRLDAAL